MRRDPLRRYFLPALTRADYPITFFTDATPPNEIRLMSTTLASEADIVLIAHRVIERTPATECLRFRAEAAFLGTGLTERCSLCDSTRCEGRGQEAREAAKKGFVSLLHSNAVNYRVCEVCRTEPWDSWLQSRPRC